MRFSPSSRAVVAALLARPRPDGSRRPRRRPSTPPSRKPKPTHLSKSDDLWATINVCDTRRAPRHDRHPRLDARSRQPHAAPADALPGPVQGQDGRQVAQHRRRRRLRLEDGRPRPRKQVIESGQNFTFLPPTDGGAHRCAASVRFKWTRPARSVARERRVTEAGHRATAGRRPRRLQRRASARSRRPDEQPRVVGDHARDAHAPRAGRSRRVVHRPDVELAAGLADGARPSRGVTSRQKAMIASQNPERSSTPGAAGERLARRPEQRRASGALCSGDARVVPPRLRDRPAERDRRVELADAGEARRAPWSEISVRPSRSRSRAPPARGPRSRRSLRSTSSRTSRPARWSRPSSSDGHVVTSWV